MPPDQPAAPASFPVSVPASVPASASATVPASVSATVSVTISVGHGFSLGFCLGNCLDFGHRFSLGFCLGNCPGFGHGFSSGFRAGVSLLFAFPPALEGFLPRQVLLRLVRRCALVGQAGGPEEPRHPVGRQGADAEPMPDPLFLQDDPVRMVFRQHRVVGADTLDEAAVAGHPRIGHDNAVEGALFRPAPGQSDA